MTNININSPIQTKMEPEKPNETLESQITGALLETENFVRGLVRRLVDFLRYVFDIFLYCVFYVNINLDLNTIFFTMLGILR